MPWALIKFSDFLNERLFKGDNVINVCCLVPLWVVVKLCENDFVSRVLKCAFRPFNLKN